MKRGRADNCRIPHGRDDDGADQDSARPPDLAPAWRRINAAGHYRTCSVKAPQAHRESKTVERTFIAELSKRGHARDRIERNCDHAYCKGKSYQLIEHEYDRLPRSDRQA